MAEDSKKYPELDSEWVSDILVGAFEGGSNYWVRKVIIPDDMAEKFDGKYASDIPGEGGKILVVEYKMGTYTKNCPHHEVTKETIQRGWERFLAHRFKDEEIPDMKDLSSMLDAGDYDCILQFGIFGELIYG